MKNFSQSNTCLIDMSKQEEEDDEIQFKEEMMMDFNFEQAEKVLELKRRLKILLLSTLFLMSIILIVYSVISDLKSQEGIIHIF